MKNRNLIIVGAVAVLLVILLVLNRQVFLPGQGGDPPGDPPTPTSGSVAVPLPAVFPKDFPMYPGAIYTGADQDQGDVNGRPWDRGWFEVHDDPQKVIDWYTGSLPKAGYPPVAVEKNGTDRRFSFASGKPVIEMQIYSNPGQPTTWSVDLFTK